MGFVMPLRYPQCMLPTSRGLVPHLTKDYADLLPYEMVELSINTLFETELFFNNQKSVKEIFKFTNHQNVASFTSVTNENILQEKDSISFCSYSGVKKIPFEKMCKSLQWMSLDAVMAPLIPANYFAEKSCKTSFSGENCSNSDGSDRKGPNILAENAADRQVKIRNSKAKTKALQKTATFLELLLKHEIPIVAPVEYFDASAENMTSFSSFLKQHDSQFCGYWMFPSTLLSFNSDLPQFIKDKKKFIIGCDNLVEILRCIELGGDCFDSQYATLLTEEGYALTGSFDSPSSSSQLKCNLWNPIFLYDTNPILPECQCLACQRHTRCYIHHLLNVNEMLASTLLSHHNLYQFSLFFSQVRESLTQGTFQMKKEAFLSTYCNTELDATITMGKRKLEQN